MSFQHGYIVMVTCPSEPNTFLISPCLHTVCSVNYLAPLFSQLSLHAMCQEDSTPDLYC